MERLDGRVVVLGVTGGIAAYKAADLVSGLKKRGADVHVIMTKAACEFVTPLTFETLSKNRVIHDMFARDFSFDVKHISLAKKADVFAIVPATANIIGKLACGISDDMLSTTAMATRAPMLIAPAMNTAMIANRAVQNNLRILEERGAVLVEPAEGILACGDVGAGKLAPVTVIEEVLLSMLGSDDYNGISVLVTAGPTREPIDPVRYISNHSSGKMGYALASKAAARGANVTLVSGPVALEPPLGVEFVPVSTAREMFDAVMERAAFADVIIKAAAVSDYRSKDMFEEKLKKGDEERTIVLEKNPDILYELGRSKRKGQVLCGFSMETQDLVENSQKKLKEKNCDLMVANNLKVEGAGFAVDTNVVTLLYPDGETVVMPIMHKRELADGILSILVKMI